MKASIAFVTLAFLTLAVHSWQQYPFLSVRRVRVGEATPQIDQLHQPGIKRAVGSTCKYLDDCISGCCAENSLTRQRYCRPLALYGKRCDESQLKGGYYWDSCPCAAGEGYCINNVCSA